jgi:flagellar hook protein FlgE
MSFYTSLSGLKNAQTSLNVISHNIANAETGGFKKSRVEFSDIVAGSAYTNPKLIVGMGSTVAAINQNFAIGPVEQTGSALDIAIAGDGFFEIQNGATGETMFTRNGALTSDDVGFIHDGSNNRLQIFANPTPTGPMGTIDPTTAPRVDAQIPQINTHVTPNASFAGVAILSDGSLTASYDDGSNLVIGRVVLANFTSPTGLRQVGSSNWVTTGLSGQPEYGLPSEGVYGELMSGALERSNVDLSDELVGLITAQRYFQANAKAIDTATQLSQTVLNLRS